MAKPLGRMPAFLQRNPRASSALPQRLSSHRPRASSQTGGGHGFEAYRRFHASRRSYIRYRPARIGHVPPRGGSVFTERAFHNRRRLARTPQLPAGPVEGHRTLGQRTPLRRSRWSRWRPGRLPHSFVFAGRSKEVSKADFVAISEKWFASWDPMKSGNLAEKDIADGVGKLLPGPRPGAPAREGRPHGRR